MSRTTDSLSDALGAYVHDLSARRQDPLLARLREVTGALEMARMQISIEQGQLMGVLCGLMGARRAIEVGVFTGYSALCVARRLPPAPEGRLVACDVSEEYTSVARRFWEEDGVADRIDLRLGDASDTLEALLADGEAGSYDFAFVDADKSAYPAYAKRCLALLRPGGLLALDNAFLGGRVAEDPPADGGPTIVRELTETLFADPAVDPALVPIGDGLLLARKR